MDEHFNLALHGFEGMRKSGSAQCCSILFFCVLYSSTIFILTVAAASVKQTRIYLPYSPVTLAISFTVALSNCPFFILHTQLPPSVDGILILASLPRFR